jgi:hypothetical protein
MDEIWVISENEKDTLLNSGIKVPVRAISQPIDTSYISNMTTSFTLNNYVDKYFKFYTIGEYIQRKNFNDVITAFHLEFDITEPVALIIKTSSGDPNRLFNSIKDSCTKIKNSLRIGKTFHEEIIFTHKMPPEQLSAIHNYGDCFISASYGEAFCRPAAEALCNGKYCILSSNIGVNQSIDSEDHSVIECCAQPVILDDPSWIGHMDIYKGNETWYKPSIIDLRKKMRMAFENRPKVDKNKYLERFSYKYIGKSLCQFLQ